MEERLEIKAKVYLHVKTQVRLIILSVLQILTKG